MTDDGNSWRVRVQNGGITGLRLDTRYFATTPGCPMHGHAIRNCQCRAFLTQADAEAYIAEQLSELRDDD